jgi:subtilisin family serine protease
VHKVRTILGDNADNPRFIETLARRGYRFVAPVHSRTLDGEVPRRMIAVLPFVNLGGDPQQEYFVDGMTDALIEAGRNPGLGVRKLHESGIDGRGVGLAIIDQPLLREHSEYKHALVKYEAIEVDGFGPQMHGPAVASLAVGKTCGVAPGASLYYFAVPMWEWLDTTPWAELLKRIIADGRA